MTLTTSRNNPLLAELRDEWRWMMNRKKFLEEWLGWVSSATEIRRIWPDAKPADVLQARKVIARLVANS